VKRTRTSHVAQAWNDSPTTMRESMARERRPKDPLDGPPDAGRSTEQERCRAQAPGAEGDWAEDDRRLHEKRELLRLRGPGKDANRGFDIPTMPH